MTQSQPEPPLFVDLDGTIISTDITWESIVDGAFRPMWNFLRLPFWYLKGRPYLKRRISVTSQPEPSLLPYHQDVVDWLKEEKSRGRTIILASASDIHQVTNVASYLDVFDTVIATDGDPNLKGKQKLKVMRRHLEDPEAAFDYAGDSSADLPIWEHAREAIVVSAREQVLDAARKTSNVTRVFDKEHARQSVWPTFGVGHWPGNLLIFVIPILAGLPTHTNSILDLIAGCVTLVALTVCSSICASVFFIQEDRGAGIVSPLSTGELKISSALKVLMVLLGLALITGFLAFHPIVVLIALPVFICLSVAARRKAVTSIPGFTTRIAVHILQLLAGYAVFLSW